MFTMITTMKSTAMHHMLFWRKGGFSLLVLPLLLFSLVGGGTEIAHASAQLPLPTISSQRADSAPVLSLLSGTQYRIGWTGTNTAHNLNMMTYNSTTKTFGSAQVLMETTLAGSGFSLETFAKNFYVAWQGTDHRLNIGQYDPANPSHLINKVILNERSNNAPVLYGAMNGLYLSWRGTDGHLNILSSTNGSQFDSKITYPFVIRTSPSLVRSYNTLFVAWEDMSASSHIVFASSKDIMHPINLTTVVTTTSSSLFPVALQTTAAVSAPLVNVAWRTTSDAHIHTGTFTGSAVISFSVDTEQTTPYGPALPPISSLPMSWTGTDAAHSINVA